MAPMTREGEHRDYPIANSTRQMRVFISSTFLDMQEETGHSDQEGFSPTPKALRSSGRDMDRSGFALGDYCRAVLREGKVLPLCLEEIHRCRPYFIGLLGERYGSVLDPASIPAELMESQPWLREHLQNSVTELEILYGVFTNKEKGHASFYFRDPGYPELLRPEKRMDFAVESAEAATKLAALKERIRTAHDENVCELRENYRNPEQLGEWILEDFTDLIDRLYPEDQAPESLDQEASRHEAYARSRRLAFVGREALLGRLNEHAGASGEPLVLRGDPGCGKSALLGEWVARWREAHSEDLIIQHYVGSTPGGAEWQELVGRILAELRRNFDITDEIPIQAESLRGALNDWAGKAAVPRRIVLVLDALDQLAEEGGARQLGWLPHVFPANFCVIVSSTPGETLVALRKRAWEELEVPLFSQADLVEAARQYFKGFGKTLPSDIEAKLESTSAARNPLYLRAVLDELRQFGSRKQLYSRAIDYLAAEELPDLYDRILGRWHDDFGYDSDYPDLVGRMLRLLACARFGLSESELRGLLGENGEPLPHVKWTPLLLAIESSLVQRAGLFAIGHQHLRRALQERMLTTEAMRSETHRVLAEYFGGGGDWTRRRLEEQPWQLAKAKAWNELHSVLTTLDVFRALHEMERTQLIWYWQRLPEDYDIVRSYRASVSDWTHRVGDVGDRASLLGAVGDVLFDAGKYADAEAVMLDSLVACESAYGSNSGEVAETLHKIASALGAQNRLEMAKTLMERALKIDQQEYGSVHPNVGRDLSYLAQLSRCMNRPGEAESLYRKAIEVNEACLGPGHPKLAQDLNNLALLEWNRRRTDEAEALLRQTIALLESSVGLRHPHYSAAVDNLGRLYAQLGSFSEAERLHRQSLEIDREIFGENYFAVARDLINLGYALYGQGRFTETEEAYRTAIAIDERCYGADHPEVATDLNSLAGLLRSTGRMEEAEELLRRGLDIQERHLGEDHPLVAHQLNNLAELLRATGRVMEAEPLSKRHLGVIWRRTLESGEEHPLLNPAVENYRALLIEMGLSHDEIIARLKSAMPTGGGQERIRVWKTPN